MARRHSPEKRVANSRQNAWAGRILAAVRALSGMNQSAFGAELARRLGVPRFGQSAVSAWEAAQRSIPASVLIAAAEVADESGLQCVLPSAQVLKRSELESPARWVATTVPTANR